MISALATPTLPKTRIFVEPAHLTADRAVLSGSSHHHLRNVLRFKPGDELVVFDGSGRECFGVLELFQGETAVVRILGDAGRSTESALDLCIAPCLAKGKKIDLVVEKAIELGADRICGVISERSIGRLEPTQAMERVERWRRVARAAAEQCGRTVLPVIERIRTFEEFVASKPPDTLGLLFTTAASQTPAATLRRNHPDVVRVIALIGPEGGFSAEEVEFAERHGFVPVGLGPRVLRTETAAIVAAALCQHIWGDLGRRAPGSNGN
ncbi:MAG TPA: 16S rRNA (uracil(1498)-N(3))-methyltransferase [Candidatus Binatia bacterium]|jgi:16S rRNA (uracil1498-N3)-methyltransferase